MRALASRLCRLEVRFASRMSARPGWNAKEILQERIEAMAQRIRADGRGVPESGPLADAAFLDVKERLARWCESVAR